MARYKKLIYIVTSLFLIASCNPGSTPSTPEVIIDEDARVYLSHNPSTSHILVGSNRTLSPVLISKKLTKNIKYISSNPGAFTVDDNGVVTAVGAGSSLFTIYNDNNNNGQLDENEPTAYASYLASNPESGYGVVLDKTEITLKVGEEAIISPRAYGIPNPYFSYYASDSSIVTAYNGRVKGLKPGTTNLNVYAGTPAYEANCTVTVTDNVDGSGIRADGISFNEKTKTLKVGESFTPGFEITPSRAVDAVKTLNSNNNVVTVTNNSTVTASKSGTAILTIKTQNDKYDRMKVVVTDDEVDEDTYYFDYYGDLSWENGEDLKNKLHDIISHKNSLYYNGSKTNWDSNKAADEYIEDHNYVSAIYSNEPILKSSTNTGWQREHCFAASLMTGITTGDAVKTLGRATDFHNLYAANKSGNTSRGNKNFGFANTESYRYFNADGAYFYDDKNFEPKDSDKGKVARAIFYMGVMYNSEETFNDGGIQYQAQPLEIVEDYVSYTTYSFDKFIDTSSSQCGRFYNKYMQIVRELNPTVTDENDLQKLAYQYYKNTNSPCAIGNLSTLLMWNAFDVDEQEMQHNISVCTYDSPAGKGIQGNRNPFVDYPELVEYVYGDLKDQPGSLKELDASIKHLDIEDKEAPDIPDVPPEPPVETGLDACSWNYRPSSGNKNDYSGSGTTYVATFGSMKFDVVFANSVALANKNTEPSGTKIGDGTNAAAGTATLTTQQSLNNVDAVYFEAGGASSKKYNYKIYVNDVEKLSGEINGSQIVELGGTFEATSGKVKIVITDITAALYLCGFGINYDK